MFNKKTETKILRRYSPNWEMNVYDRSTPPSIYEFLYKFDTSEIHITLNRNSKVGSQVIFSIFYQDYTLYFYFQNKNNYNYWVEIYDDDILIATNEVSYEMTNSLLRLLPKQLKKPFRNMLLADNLPRKWSCLKEYLSAFTPDDSQKVKTPTILRLDMLQAGAYPYQITGTEMINKTYYYFKI